MKPSAEGCGCLLAAAFWGFVGAVLAWWLAFGS